MIRNDRPNLNSVYGILHFNYVSKVVNFNIVLKLIMHGPNNQLMSLKSNCLGYSNLFGTNNAYEEDILFSCLYVFKIRHNVVLFVHIHNCIYKL